jgi:hypothetical protein
MEELYGVILEKPKNTSVSSTTTKKQPPLLHYLTDLNVIHYFHQKKV